jgi:hypothetical protein
MRGPQNPIRRMLIRLASPFMTPTTGSLPPEAAEGSRAGGVQNPVAASAKAMTSARLPEPRFGDLGNGLAVAFLLGVSCTTSRPCSTRPDTREGVPGFQLAAWRAGAPFWWVVFWRR